MSKIGYNLRRIGDCKVSSLKKLTPVILLMLYSSTLTVTPLAIAATNISKQTTLVPYNIIRGDTVSGIAQKYGLKTEQLVLLNKNAPNPIPHDYSIKIGQVIYVPNGKVIDLPELGGLQTKSPELAGFIELEKFVAQQAIRQGNNFSNNEKSNYYSQAISQGGVLANPQDSYNQWLQKNGGEPQDFNDRKYTTEDEKRYWQQQVSSQASLVSQDFMRDNLSGFGTVKTELIFDEDFNITNFGLDVLAPLHDIESRLAFAQVGVHHLDSTNKTTTNLGLGQRHFFEQWMFGYNGFFDTTLSNAENDSHQRLGLGIESWADHFKFGINYYTPLSSWKDSQLFDNYEERAAKGFDVRFDYYLPSYPQLGLNAKYEQYFGDEVDIMGNKQRQRDPYSATVGVEWQPIPLVSLNVEHTEAKGGQSNTQGTVNLEWKMGASLNDMLDPDKVAGKRSLKGMRYDLVERNNSIVLEYREKQSSIEISHATISGMSGDKVTLTPEVKISGKAEITHWEWYSPDEKIQQGLSFALSQSPELTLPELALDYEGIYESSIFLKVTDSNGKVYYSASIPIAVLVNPNAYVKRISIPALGVDSKENPTTELTIEEQHIDIHWYFVRQHKTDAQQYAVVKAERVDIQVPDGYEVETFDGEYISGHWNGNEISNVWRNHLRIKPTAIQSYDYKTKSVLPVVQLTAIGQGGAHVETVSFYLNTATAIDPNAKPVVSDLQMAGKLEVGESLTATYTFDANGGDVNDKSTYAWGNEGDTVVAVPAGQTVANSGEVPSYVLVKADIGEVKELSVQAQNGLAVIGNTVTVDTKGSMVIDPTDIKVQVNFTSTATESLNGAGSDGRPVANTDLMTAECQIAGEPNFTPCDTRFELQWLVDGTAVAGANAVNYTPDSTVQGQAVAVEVMLKP